MDLNWMFFLAAVPAVLFAGVSKGGFGSAAAFAAAPFLALILEPAEAVAVMLPLLIVMDFTALRAYWRQWDWRIARVLVLGSLPGCLLGAVLVSVAPADLFRFLIGAMAVGFVIFQISRQRGWIRTASVPMPDRAGYGFGFGAGFTSFISHAGGPMTAIFMLSRQMTKTAYQATTVIVFWAINLVKLGLYAGLGFFNGPMLLADLYLVPVAIAGTYLGVFLHRIVSEALFFRLTYVFLTVTGAKLIWDALT